jgi:hypothetical protein
VDAASEFRLPFLPRHGSVYRVIAVAVDGAGNSQATVLGCVVVDKTPPVVAFAGFPGAGVVSPAPFGLLYTSQDLEPLTAAFTVTEDLSPLASFAHCWSTNNQGTCDVTPRVVDGVQGQPLSLTPNVSLDLSSPGVRADLDGTQVCAWVSATSTTSSSPTPLASPCVTLDFSPPLAGVVFDGPVTNVDRAFFGSSTGAVYATWTGFVDVGAGTIVGYDVTLISA